MHNTRLTTLPTGDDRFGLGADFFGLSREQVGHLRRMEARVNRRGSVEDGNGVENRVLLWRQQQRLTKGFVTPLGPIHTDHRPCEHAHLATLSAHGLPGFRPGAQSAT